MLEENKPPESPLKKEIDKNSPNKNKKSPNFSPEKEKASGSVNSKEILEDKIDESGFLDEKNHQEFLLKCEEEKNSKILKGFSILSKVYKNKNQKSDPNYLDMTKSKSIRGNDTIIQTTDLSIFEIDQEHKKEVSTIIDRSDSEEEKKSIRITPREIKSSMNMSIRSTKASGFRKVKNLTVKTIVDINNNNLVPRKGGRTLVKASTIVNTESPLQTSPIKKQIRKENERLIDLRTQKISKPKTFLGTTFLEEEINEIRPYHRLGIEVNYPDLLKNKNIMGSCFSNDFRINRKTLYSKKLEEKMKKQIKKDEEEEYSEKWGRCDFNSKNACKCSIF